MARKRGQRKGFVFRRGPSWIVQWREDVRGVDGSLARHKFARVIGPATGPDAIKKREAQRLAWETILCKLDAVSLRPQSLATVGEFIRGKFEPEVVYNLKASGKKHYTYLLANHVLPALGSKRLRDVTFDDVQKLVREKLEAGLSVQTAAHVRNCVSAVFRHANAKGYYTGENPAHDVRLPEMTRREKHALTWEQARKVLV